jgi:hypothetical protein
MPYLQDKRVASIRNPVSPQTVLVGSFATTIIAGTIMLMLPAMSVEGKLGFIDALFTAISAVCGAETDSISCNASRMAPAERVNHDLSLT